MGLLRCFQTDSEDVDDDDNKVTMILKSLRNPQNARLLLNVEEEQEEDVIKAQQAIVLSDDEEK